MGGMGTPSFLYLVSNSLFIVDTSFFMLYICCVLRCLLMATMLLLLVPPSFLHVGKLDHEENEGSNITLDCSCSGVPKPNITWKHVERAFDTTRTKYSSVGLLTIAYLQPSDHGTYNCHVISPAGTLFRSIKLAVIGKCLGYCIIGEYIY